MCIIRGSSSHAFACTRTQNQRNVFSKFNPCFCFLARGTNEWHSHPLFLLQTKVRPHMADTEVYLNQPTTVRSFHPTLSLLALDRFLLIFCSFAPFLRTMSLPVEPYSNTDLYVWNPWQFSTHSAGCFWGHHGSCNAFMRSAILCSLCYSQKILPWWLSHDVCICTCPVFSHLVNVCLGSVHYQWQLTDIHGQKRGA